MTATLDPEDCYRALSARDARFDGVFFVGVHTTGIYCRPVCSARTPRRDRCAFFGSAAEAEHEGFRACFRCRPELAPGHAPIDATSRLVRDALARVDAGHLDEGSVEQLAGALGVSARHLRRAMEAELGVGPVELAQSRRVALARKLLAQTSLSVAQIAFASGFSSVRRMNTVFRARTGRSPTAFRALGAAAADPTDGVTLRLEHRAPYAWEAMLGFLATRAIEGVEQVEGDAYLRSASIGAARGWIRVARAGDRALEVRVSPALVGGIGGLVPRVRALFDLDARPAPIDGHLGADAVLGSRVRALAGLRVPGAFDGAELAVRAVLGQQISVRGATTIAGRLCAALGEPCAEGLFERCFPSASAIAAASEPELRALGLTGARARTLKALAERLATGEVSLVRGSDPEATRAALLAVPGIGPWTAELCVMRALGWPDAFPAGDLGVRKALARGDEEVPSERLARERSEAWQPWRSYAVMHLWMGETT
ncbi:MAG: DNA-3-methyladenine glycosylase 2 family protein [Sandaracinaceae bacterium]|nr:DNA-3-methyladenine glycosylase 2 family protein [Sandaracinaceae bacterium]